METIAVPFRFYDCTLETGQKKSSPLMQESSFLSFSVSVCNLFSKQSPFKALPNQIKTLSPKRIFFLLTFMFFLLLSFLFYTYRFFSSRSTCFAVMRSGEFSTVSGSLCEKQGPKYSAIFLTALITDCDLISSVVVFERRFVDVSERRCDSFAPVVCFAARGLFGGRAAGTGRDGTLYAVTRSISVKTEERPSR